MLTGVDWGGTKIEIVAMTPDGEEHVRARRDTPRGDYAGCLGTIRELVDETEERVGRIERVGVGIPGSIDPLTGLGKGASSTWLIGQRVEDDLRTTLGGRDVRVANDADLLAASEARDGAGAGYGVVFAANFASGVGAGLAVGGHAHTPNEDSIAALTAGNGAGGKLSWSSDRFAAALAPTRSGRVDRAWPSLIAAGPISCMALA
jgi:fructokinase